jgi:hypothetical protein
VAVGVRGGANVPENRDGGRGHTSDPDADGHGERAETGEPPDEIDERPDGSGEPGGRAPRLRRLRSVGSWTTTGLACLLVLFALIGPNQLGQLTPAVVVRIPIEGLLAVALLLVLPARARAVAAVLIGLLLGVLAIVKVIDIGFFGILARPFDLVLDWPLLEATMDFLVEAYGGTTANVVAVGAVVLAVAVLVFTPLAVLRLTRRGRGKSSGS